MKQIWFIINPNAGIKLKNGTAGLKAQILAETHRNAPCQTIIKTTTHAEHATELAREGAAAGANAVVAIGGDGTVNEVARGLLFSQTALGIVPLGSGNGLARHLGIPMQTDKALKRVFDGQVQTIDSATLNNIPFFCTAGLGFDAHVAHKFSQQKSRGLITYINVSFRSFWNFKPQTYHSNEQEKTLFTLTFANASQFGNNAYIAPNAQTDDGFLDMCQVSRFPLWQGVVMAWRLFAKCLDTWNYMDIEQIRQVKITTTQPPLIHYDGESMQLKTNELYIEIVPNSLKILV